MRPRSLPLDERSTHSPSPRSGRAQAGIWQGVPSGSTQSAQSPSSRANARPSSMVSTLKRSSTSASTMASCWIGSYTRIGRSSRPRCRRSRAYAMAAMPEERCPEKSTGTLSTS